MLGIAGFVAGLAAALAALAAPAAASPATPPAADIEAVWTFDDGQVAIDARPGGRFVGTVIRPTRFSHCEHRKGERMWTGIRAGPDGSYRGRHRFFGSADCQPVGRGNTAFRVLYRPDGSRFLRACMAFPEQSDVQPAVAPNGTAANAPSGCYDSDAVSDLPSRPPRLEEIAELPGDKRCIDRRHIRIRLKEPRGDALARVVVRMDGRRIAVRRGRHTAAPVHLRELPGGSYVVGIAAKTVRGERVKGSRTYRAC